MKDAISPTISILMKELAVISLVLVPFFASVRGGFGTIGCAISRDCDAVEYSMQGFDYLVILIFGTMAMIFCLLRVREHCASQSQFPLDVAEDTTTPLISKDTEADHIVQ